MTDYNRLRDLCRQNSEISNQFIDGVLIPYTIRHEKALEEVNRELAGFRHVTQEFKKGWLEMFKTQYIAHRIFRKDGLVVKYLKRGLVKGMNAQERQFLEFQTLHPWRFCFSIIDGHSPARDFYNMTDVFTSEPFLLYSPGITDIEDERQVMIWLNLIGFNGSCWQSYGPIEGYSGFGPDDVFFFATELNPRIESDEDVVADIEKNPVPYMMLLSGSTFPPVVHHADQVMCNQTTFYTRMPDAERMRKKFKIDYKRNVYRFQLKRWGGPPHFSTAYFDENEKLLFLSAMTDRGYASLVEALQPFVKSISDEPHVRVTLTMVSLAGKILNKEIKLDPFDHLFYTPPTPEQQAHIDKLNSLISLALPDINEGREPDFEAIAKKTGYDTDTARDIISQVTERIRTMQRKVGS